MDDPQVRKRLSKSTAELDNLLQGMFVLGEHTELKITNIELVGVKLERRTGARRMLPTKGFASGGDAQVWRAMCELSTTSSYATSIYGKVGACTLANYWCLRRRGVYNDLFGRSKGNKPPTGSYPKCPYVFSRPFKSLLSSSFLKTIKAHWLPRILAAQEES